MFAGVAAVSPMFENYTFSSLTLSGLSRSSSSTQYLVSVYVSNDISVIASYAFSIMSSFRQVLLKDTVVGHVP